jgi:hypothetical protein
MNDTEWITILQRAAFEKRSQSNGFYVGDSDRSLGSVVHICKKLKLLGNMLNDFNIRHPRRYTGCFKKSFTTLKAYINVYRGHTQDFELS